jgi:hypothetical protein
MSVGSVSLYQQDQSYWSQAQAQSQVQSADASLINVMGTAEVDQAKGEASIANKTALNRVNNQITALVQQVLSGNSPSSSSSSASASTGSSSTSSSTGAPATGTGTVPVTTGTSLSSLGVLAGGTISVSAGANLTTYTSTGTDTVGDLINALNVDLPTNAQVTASLNNKGDLVITSRNTSDVVVVSGIYASNIGFAANNNTFTPVAPKAKTAAAATTASTSSTTTSSAASSSAKSGKTASSTAKVLSPTQQNFSTAAGILSADGVSGSLIDMLA